MFAVFVFLSNLHNLFVYLDSSLSEWRVQVEILVDAVQTTNGQITLSIPELDSEQTFHTQFLFGKNKNTFVLHINMVLDTVQSNCWDF